MNVGSDNTGLKPITGKDAFDDLLGLCAKGRSKMTNKEEQNKGMKNEDVVWIAVAALTYDICQKNPDDWKLGDVGFTQEDIQKSAKRIFGKEFAEYITDKSINRATITPNGQDNNYAYLSVVVSTRRNQKKRRLRLTYVGEHGGVNEHPVWLRKELDELDKKQTESQNNPVVSRMEENIDIPTKSGNISIRELYDFVENVYTNRVKDFLKGVKPTAVAEKDEPKMSKNRPKKQEYDKNLILYGPPGTGKTYDSVNYAVAICEGKDVKEVQNEEYEEVLERYRKLKKAGRIAFTTFHQSYGYEEFIEGIKPVVDEDESELRYVIEPGLFKRFCEKARTPDKTSIYSAPRKIWNVRNRAKDDDVNFDLEDYMYSEGAVLVEDLADKRRQCDLLERLEFGDWVVLGREHNIDAIGVVADYEASTIEKEPFHYQRKINWLATKLNKSFEDIGKAEMGFSNFAVAKSRLKAADLYPLLGDSEVNDKPYVFIIDEINRGNISKIFGELITLIEDTKREGEAEAMETILPYSGETFSVPKNVYIIGTMNTADRSIALMDTALRRRFEFKEMMPDIGVLEKRGIDTITVEGESLDVAGMLEVMNKRIEYLYDREHTLGHAFFIKLEKEPTINTLAEIFSKKIIPLLQEYFYEDYEKIQLVLGDNGKDDEFKFVKDSLVKPEAIFNGKPKDLEVEKNYMIQESAFKRIQSYKQISKDL